MRSRPRNMPWEFPHPPPGPRTLPCGKRAEGYQNCLTHCPGKRPAEVRECYYGRLKSR